MKFNSKPIPEHKEVPLADDGRWEGIVEQWTQTDASIGTHKNTNGNACYVLSVSYKRDPLIQKAQLAEIVSLVKAQGDRVVGQEIYYLTKKHPKTLLGKGTSKDIATRAQECDANLLVLDAELSPSQMRNLEDASGISICDREAIILNVFLRHARTRNAQIQIEIAQLEYLRPRIRGIGLDMDQQTGGISGSRGVGETASELLARKLDGRLAELKKMQRKVESVDKNQRQQRDYCKRIALIGYTNAGKTSLMNALAGEQLSTRNMPFQTLDTTSRCLSRHGGDVIISDTVGFIRRLPKSLLPSFETTLAEIRESSLLVIVVDSSDYEWQQHLKTTTIVLKKLQAMEIPRFYVFNKIDCLDVVPNGALLERLSEGYPYVAISSQNEKAVLELKESLLEIVRKDQEILDLVVPYTASEIISLIFAKCRIIKNDAMANAMNLTIEAPSVIIAQVKHKLEKLSK